MKNYLSIDFESWAYPDLPEFLALSSQERKKTDAGFVKDSAQEILKILDKNKVKLTFFVLGQLYDWYPKVIEKIAESGHEIAYHTYTHNLLRSKKDLVDSLEKSKNFLKKFKPIGFRAPTILIKKEDYQVLKDYGFKSHRAYIKCVTANFGIVYDDERVKIRPTVKDTSRGGFEGLPDDTVRYCKLDAEEIGNVLKKMYEQYKK